MRSYSLEAGVTRARSAHSRRVRVVSPVFAEPLDSPFNPGDGNRWRVISLEFQFWIGKTHTHRRDPRSPGVIVGAAAILRAFELAFDRDRGEHTLSLIRDPPVYSDNNKGAIYLCPSAKKIAT